MAKLWPEASLPFSSQSILATHVATRLNDRWASARPAGCIQGPGVHTQTWKDERTTNTHPASDGDDTVRVLEEGDVAGHAVLALEDGGSGLALVYAR